MWKLATSLTVFTLTLSGGSKLAKNVAVAVTGRKADIDRINTNNTASRASFNIEEVADVRKRRSAATE